MTRGLPQMMTTLSLLILVLLPGCQDLPSALRAAPKPTASIKSVRFQDLRLDGLTLLFDVDVKNPYGFALPLVNADYTLTSGEAQILSGVAEMQGSIPAKASKTLTLPASLKFMDVLNVLQGVRPGMVVPYAAQLNFNAETPALGKVNVPVSKKGELPVPAAPKVELSELKVKEMSLTQVSAVLNLRLTNTNQFPVDLNQLGYDLSLGGTKIASSKLSSATKFAKNSSGDLSIPLSLSPLSLGVAVVNMLKGSSAAYELSGILDLNTPYGPIHMPYHRVGQAPISR